MKNKTRIKRIEKYVDNRCEPVSSPFEKQYQTKIKKEQTNSSDNVIYSDIIKFIKKLN